MVELSLEHMLFLSILWAFQYEVLDQLQYQKFLTVGTDWSFRLANAE